jgi:GNAT superfamily N-acetyltransferase
MEPIDKFLKSQNLKLFVHGIEDIDQFGSLWKEFCAEVNKLETFPQPDPTDQVWLNLRNHLVARSQRGVFSLFELKDLSGKETIAMSIQTARKDGVGFIDTLYVRPKYRKLGIATNLMKSLRIWFHKHNVKVIRIIANGGNEEAMKLYLKNGFEPEFITLRNKESAGIKI